MILEGNEKDVKYSVVIPVIRTVLGVTGELGVSGCLTLMEVK